MGWLGCLRDYLSYSCNTGEVIIKMIHQIILLIVIILNLGWTSFLAFKGKKNLLLVFGLLEAVLGILFALTV